MKFKKRISAINDNSPQPKEAIQESETWTQRITHQKNHATYGASSRLKPGHMQWTPVLDTTLPTHDTHQDTPIKSKRKHSSSSIKTLCLSLFFASLFGLFGALLAEASNVSIAGIAAFGSLCAAASLGLRQLSWRLREFLAISLLSFLSIGGVLLSGLSLPSLAIPLSLTALIVAFFSRTRLPAILGAAVLFGLAYLASPLEIAPLKFNELQGSILTATLIFYIGLASRLRSRGVMALALTCAYLWAGIWLYNSGINYAGIAGFAFIAMAAQYKLGKAGLDDDAFGSLAFLSLGWVFGFAAFLTLQWGLISGETNTIMSVGKRPASSMAWIIGAACGAAIILVAGMARHSNNQQSWLSIYISFTALCYVPFSVFRPDIAASLFEQISGFEYLPGLALIFATCGLVVSAMMIVNGLRLNRQLYISLGLLALGAQTVMLLKSSLWTFDNTVVFLTALGIASLTAVITVRSNPK